MLSFRIEGEIENFADKQKSKELINTKLIGFPGGAVVTNLPATAGDMCSSPGLGRSHMPQSN